MRLRHLLLMSQLPFWVLLLASFLTLQSSLDRRVQTLARSAQIRTQLEQVNALLTHVVDMETGVRGYVIAGQAAFLEPYYRGETGYAVTLGALKGRLDGTGNAHLARIAALIAQWQTEVAQPEIRLRPQAPGQAEALVRSGRGKRLLDQVRGEVDQLSQTLGTQFQIVNDESERQLTLLRRELALAAILLLLLSVVTVLGAARLLTHPLEALGRGTRRVTDHEASIPVEERGPREYRDLARAFNRMTRGVQDARRASADAAAQLAARNAWLSELARLSDALQAARSVDEASQILTRALPHLLPGTSGQLLQHNASRNLLVPAAQWGEAAPLPSPDTCWALRRGELQGDPPERPFMPGCAGQPQLYLCAPLFSHGETLGLLRVQPDVSTQRDAVNDVARQVALALASLRLQDRLLQQSIRDPLTGLFNRRHLETQLAAGVAAAHTLGTPLHLIALDIDHFKRLNDTFGHDAGDAALVRVSAALRELAPPGSTPARPGGEEFTLLLPQGDAPGAAALAEQMRAAVAGLSLTHDGISLGQITVSLGVATLPPGGTGAEVTAAADQALYQSKRTGRNRVTLAGELQTVPLEH